VSTVQQNVVTYQVTVNFDPGRAPVKVGMSATGDIQVDQRSDVLIVPSRAIQTQGGVQAVQVRTAPDQPVIRVQVETGLVSDGQTEIISCVETGSQCLKEGDVLVVTSAATTQRPTTQGGGFGPGGGGPGFITR
jgi:HlyD family secretion protein